MTNRRLAAVIVAGLAWAGAGHAATPGQTPQATLPAYCSGVGPPSENLPGATSFTYRTIGDRHLRIHIFAPAGGGSKRPAVLLFFGGGFRTGDVSSQVDNAQFLAAHGFVVAVADYRILCRDGVTAVTGVSDAQAAHGWLSRNAGRLGIDAKRIALGGSSAGGLLAATTTLRAPARERPVALVLINPVLALDVGTWAGDQTPAEAAAYSASALPLDNLPPTLILHGSADEIVPIQSSEGFCARAEAAGRSCRLVAYPGLHHGFNDRKKVVPALGIAPFDDTMSKIADFLSAPGNAGG